MSSDENCISAVEFGKMQGDVARLKEDCQRFERKLDQQNVKMDEQGAKIDALIALAERSKGGFWVGMAMVSALSAVFGGSFISAIHKLWGTN